MQMTFENRFGTLLLESAALVLAVLCLLSAFLDWTDLNLSQGLEFGTPSAYDYVYEYRSLGSYATICPIVLCCTMGASMAPILARFFLKKWVPAITVCVLAIDVFCAALLYCYLSWNTGWLAYTVVMGDRMMIGSYLCTVALTLSIIVNASILYISWKKNGFAHLPKNALITIGIALAIVLCIGYAAYLHAEEEPKQPHTEDRYEISYLMVYANNELLDDSSAVIITDDAQLTQIRDSSVWLRSPEGRFTEVAEYTVADGLPSSLTAGTAYPYTVETGGLSATVYAVASYDGLSVSTLQPSTRTLDCGNYRYVFDMASDGTIALSGYLTGGIEIRLNGHTADLELNDLTLIDSTGVPLRISGDGSASITVSGNVCIYDRRSSTESDLPFAIRSSVDTKITGNGHLSVFSGSHGGIRARGLDIDGPEITVDSMKNCIRSKGSLSLESCSVDLISRHSTGIRAQGPITVAAGSAVSLDIKAANNGIACKSDIAFGDGTALTVMTDRYSPYTLGSPSLLGPDEYQHNSTKGHSCKGIVSKGYIGISGGTVSVSSYDDGIHSSGDIVIDGGEITVCSGDDGIHSDSGITLNGGKYRIRSYEGIEGTGIRINGGDYRIITEDDGINNGSSSKGIITVNGGNIYIRSYGDCFDSNLERNHIGVIFNGGTVFLDAPGSDAAVDTEKGYTYNGGLVFMVCRPSVASMQSTYCSDRDQFSYACINPRNGYVTAADGEVSVTARISDTEPCLFIVLGMGSEASITISSGTKAPLDGNGVFWNLEDTDGRRRIGHAPAAAGGTRV